MAIWASSRMAIASPLERTSATAWSVVIRASGSTGKPISRSSPASTVVWSNSPSATTSVRASSMPTNVTSRPRPASSPATSRAVEPPKDQPMSRTGPLGASEATVSAYVAASSPMCSGSTPPENSGDCRP